MKTYKVSFERINFGYKPTLNQTSDVVFQTDIPYEDENLEEFERIMWDEMWKQNPHWNKAEGPIPGRAGWSSVLCAGDVVEIL